MMFCQDDIYDLRGEEVLGNGRIAHTFCYNSTIKQK